MLHAVDVILTHYYNIAGPRVDIVHDGGKLQLEFLSLRQFKPSSYSNSNAELLVGFHYEDVEFFPSSMNHSGVSGTDAAKVGFPWVS
jgi:hypothetical protein